MNRILAYLAMFSLAFLGVTLAVGLTLEDVGNHRNTTAQYWFQIHMLSGVTAGLIVLLVNSVVVTWFVGTSRWIREVSETYGLPFDFTRRSNALKRRAFPVCVVSMLLVVGIVAMGAAADPASNLPAVPPFGMTWVQVHFLAAVGGIAAIAWAFYVAWLKVVDNQRVIHEVVAAVQAIRRERGLDT